MKSAILAKAEEVTGGWIGNAFGSEGIIAIGAGRTEQELITSLRQSVDDYLVVDAAHWLAQMGHAGSPDTPNCPEGAIKLPADIWVCKVAKETCPIQAQVFLDEPDRFFEGCLLDEDRKRGIFGAVSQGEYRGFHHVRGRYLCVRCADERGNDSAFSYHYPWELSSLEDFTPFDPQRDLIEKLKILIRAGIPRSAILNALCARHSVEIAGLLYPAVAANLRVLEFDVRRPSR